MSKIPKTKILPCVQDEIANELANFFFGLWQKGYRKLNSKKHNPKIESNKAVVPVSGFTRRGSLPGIRTSA